MTLRSKRCHSCVINQMVSELVQDLWKMFKNQKNSLFKGDSSCNAWWVTGPPSFYKVPRGARSPRDGSNTCIPRGEGPARGCSCREQHNPTGKYNVSHKYNFKCFSSYIKKRKRTYFEQYIFVYPNRSKIVSFNR